MVSKPLNEDSSSTLYMQVIQHLRTAIKLGQYEIGMRLPSENQLCEEFGVSRITIRRAVRELVEDGLLESKQGKGVFVAQPRFIIHAMALTGFSSFGKEHRKGSSVQIIKKQHRLPSAKEARLLEIEMSTPVCVLIRLLLVDEMPIMLDRSVFSAERFPGMLERVTEDTSTYRLMEEVYGHPNKKVNKEITISVARPDEAEHLACKTGESLFCIEKVAYDNHDEINHLSVILCVADRVKLTLHYEKEGETTYLGNLEEKRESDG